MRAAEFYSVVEIYLARQM